MDYIDESLEDSNLTAEDEDILIIDGGCNNIDDAKYITGYWNQTLEHPELKEYVAKRSNSAFSNINDPVYRLLDHIFLFLKIDNKTLLFF